MSSLKKYGKYFIVAGIAISGSVWLHRAADPRIKGEDVADVYEAEADCHVVPYQTGDQVPDYQAANNNETSTVGSVVAYLDILTVGSRARDVWTKSGNILWTTNMIAGDTFEPSKLFGSYHVASTNNGVQVDVLNAGGYAVTNRYHSYSTNTFSDVLATTATRVFTNGMAFDPVMTIDPYDPGGESVSYTNLPVSGNVFSGAVASNLLNYTFYNSWPFDRAYQYPWEQWSYPGRSRATLLSYVAKNVAFTNIYWLSASSLEMACDPQTNGLPGYSVGAFWDINQHASVPFAFVSAADASDPLYLTVDATFDGYSVNLPYSLYQSADFWINKQGFASSKAIQVGVVYGDPLTVFSVGGGSGFEVWQAVRSQETQTNSLSVLGFGVDGTNYLYVAISIRNGDPVKTNSYFSITSDLATEGQITCTAFTNAISSSFQARDDLRIGTNKLNGLAQIITNMYRTVCFAGEGALVATNEIIRRDRSPAVVAYVSESDGDVVEEDPQYYDFGDPSQYIDTYKATAVSDCWTNSNANVKDVFEESLEYWATKNGERYTSEPSGGGWLSATIVLGDYYERRHVSYKGVSPVYPSHYALTNGMVKKVTIYAVYENFMLLEQGYLSVPDGGTAPDYFTHDVSGAYWTTANVGLTVSGETVSSPTDTIPDTRVKGNHNTYATRLNSQAVYCKIAETNNPADTIYFDIPEATVNGIDFASRHGYSYFTTDDGTDDDWTESFIWNYTAGARLQMTRFAIVVDWDFKHLGRGFTPPTE